MKKLCIECGEDATKTEDKYFIVPSTLFGVPNAYSTCDKHKHLFFDFYEIKEKIDDKTIFNGKITKSNYKKLKKIFDLCYSVRLNKNQNHWR